ncbi:MAG: hypothetical protein KC543_10050 [Myxococcales bacterium]|nr:hypothetical protein [Myxococcales bacterium]
MRILSADTPSAAADKFGAGKDGFTEGDPTIAVPATVLSAYWADGIQENLARLCERFGAPLGKYNFLSLQMALVGALTEACAANWRSTVVSVKDPQEPTSPLDLVGCAVGSGVLAAVGEDGRYWTSYDGEAWFERFLVQQPFQAIHYVASADRWIITGRTANIWYANGGLGDATAWTVVNQASSGGSADWLYNIASDKYDRVIAVGCASNDPTTGVVQVSTDAGSTWSRLAPTGMSGMLAVAVGGGTWVAVGGGNTHGVWRTADTASWSKTASATSALTGVAHATLEGIGATWVVVGRGGIVMRSLDDGVTWESGAVVDDDLESVCGWNGVFVACGPRGFWQSRDGLTWARVAVPGDSTRTKPIAIAAPTSGPTDDYASHCLLAVGTRQRDDDEDEYLAWTTLRLGKLAVVT